MHPLLNIQLARQVQKERRRRAEEHRRPAPGARGETRRKGTRRRDREPPGPRAGAPITRACTRTSERCGRSGGAYSMK